MLLIDPASGWKYGFPKPYDNPENKPLAEWLVENGYPKEELNAKGECHYCRFLGGVEELEELNDVSGMLPAFAKEGK